ncbi:Hypothetical predicted protein [Paramuricea clavata]|uniref:Uncharacterized protein n=1 Tax=Paramuricea clavata TaxID=317549 RepID=A0A6S7HV73_PARCT|nr:Hypothetical predicted protein [Paramuricea clavata]
MKDMEDKYPEYDDKSYDELFSDFQELTTRRNRIINNSSLDPTDIDSEIKYVKSLMEKLSANQQSTSFTSGDDGKTVTITNGSREVTAPAVEFVDMSDRPENDIRPAVEDFISKHYDRRDFKFNLHSDKVSELRLNLNRTGKNNRTYRPLTNSNTRGKEQIVLKRVNGDLQYNKANVAKEAVAQFKRHVDDILSEQATNFPVIETDMERPRIKGLDQEENRDLEGVVNPSDYIDPQSRIGDNGALQIQADHFQKALDRTIDQRDRTNDPMEFIELQERINGLREARDRTLQQREIEEVRAQQEEDVSRLQRFKEWAKENMLGLSAVAITVAGIITTVVIGARTAIIKGAQATSKFAKALANLGKKLGPMLLPLFNMLAKLVSLGAKGLAWLASNLWVLAIAVAWFVYDYFKERRRKK